MGQAIHYSADGLQLTGYLSEPAAGGPVPGVLVAHEAMGLNDHIRSRADRLAEHGYAAFALDLYGAADLELAEAQPKSAEIMRTPGLLLSRGLAGLNAFLDRPNVDAKRIAAIGFCQGGSTIMELARAGAPFKAVVGFHPGFTRPAGSVQASVSGKVLMMVGDADPVVTADERATFIEEMRSSGADWELHVFGGVGHSYTNPRIDELGYPGFAYSPAADERSWQMMLALLSDVFADERA